MDRVSQKYFIPLPVPISSFLSGMDALTAPHSKNTRWNASGTSSTTKLHRSTVKKYFCSYRSVPLYLIRESPPSSSMDLSPKDTKMIKRENFLRKNLIPVN